MIAGAAAHKSPEFTSTALQMAIWYELPSHISVELARQILELHVHGWAPLFANTRSVKVALMAAATITSKPRETIESKLIFCCFVMLRATEKCQDNLLRVTRGCLRIRGVTNIIKITSERMLTVADVMMPGSWLPHTAGTMFQSPIQMLLKVRERQDKSVRNHTRNWLALEEDT